MLQILWVISLLVGLSMVFFPASAREVMAVLSFQAFMGNFWRKMGNLPCRLIGIAGICFLLLAYRSSVH